ncbi:hypothetical protein SCA6_001929 [Theobroma cacao]
MEVTKLLSLCILITFLCVDIINLNNGGVDASHKVFPQFQSLNAVSVQQIHRTGYHFQPPKNWINAPMYYNGIYHFFYQYNPKGAVWGNIVWAHSVSKDMINWEALEPALYPSQHFDINGCWSGSATVLPSNKPIILYTGLDPKDRQIQNYAVPANLSDPYLRKWIKPGNNPVVDPEQGVNASAFRDPTTAWWLNGHWRMLVGSKRNHRGMAYLYRSRDFIYWTKAKHPLHSAPHTGMWECPDFYPVLLSGKKGLDPSVLGKHVKHVLKVSLDVTRYDYYTVGTYLSDKDRYVPDNTSAIPRIVWLDPNQRQLMQWPIEELETLRGKNVKMSHQQLKKGEHIEVKGITAAQADVDVTFHIPNLDKAEPFDHSWTDAQELCVKKGSKVKGEVGPFGLLTLASKNLEEYTPVSFRVFQTSKKHVVLLCSDARSSSLKDGLYKPSFAGFVDVDLADKKLSLRSLTCMTQCSKPSIY